MATKSNASDSTMKKLIRELENYRYTARSEEEKRTEAEKKYASAYEEKRLAAQQSYDTQNAALQRQLEALQGSYDTQRTDSAAAYSAAYSQQDRNALSKGMQRSSYNGQTLAGIASAGAAAQQSLNTEQAGKEQDIRRQQTDAAGQLSEKLSSYKASEQSDILAYMDELTRQDEEKASEAQSGYTKLLSQIYEYRKAAEKEKQEQENWLAQFKAKYGKK